MSEHTPEQAFVSRIKVQQVGVHKDCWLWIGPRRGNYGVFWHKRKRYASHRWSYEHYKGESIPDGMVVMHTCDNPGCVNPDHLELGTQKENMIHASKTGRISNKKLTPQKIAFIKRTKLSEEILSARYGVWCTTIRRIRSGSNS